MNWKVFSLVCINAIALLFPYNIIGCGPDLDPYDYYTSFFNNDLGSNKDLQPFYYTNYQFLYSEEEPVNVADTTSAEWVNYFGKQVSEKDAYEFICNYAHKDLSNLYYNLEKNQPLSIPDSMKTNSVTHYFTDKKDLEALGYIMYAKQVQPLVTGSWYSWEAPTRDSLKMNKMIKSGQQLYAVVKNDFVKLRYAYQVVRLANYNHRYEDCLQWQQSMLEANKTPSVLHDLGMSLKAGALYKTGKSEEAAYLFSKQFSKLRAKKVANYMSFQWATNGLDEAAIKRSFALCKNNMEKADMKGLFALGNTGIQLPVIKEMYALSPSSAMLQTLAIREVNKIEENYFTPDLHSRKGGMQLYYTYSDESRKPDSATLAWEANAKDAATFFHAVAGNKKLNDRALYDVAAAHLSYITKNYEQANKYIASANKLTMAPDIKDQLSLTKLLVTISQKDRIDAAFEAQLLPSIKWLEAKAKDKTGNMDRYNGTQWSGFYSSLFTEVLAKRYHAQGDVYKEALCINNAGFVQDKMETKDIMAMHDLFGKTNKTDWEKYLCSHFSMKPDEVTDVIAMTHVRDYNFATAIEWLGKIKSAEVLGLHHNPFGDLLKDNIEDDYAFDKGKFDKLSFIKEMKRLSDKDKQGAATDKELYKLANGYYNMTYYGRAWNMVKYYRSGFDGYYIPKDATPFEKEYYGCFTAEKTFEKAMKKSADKNYKARCLFMMAKCAQKQVRQPQYDDFPGNYNAYDNAGKDYQKLFMHNKYFPQLIKEYGTTPFYNEVYNTCSYLKDFVKEKAN